MDNAFEMKKQLLKNYRYIYLFIWLSLFFSVFPVVFAENLQNMTTQDAIPFLESNSTGAEKVIITPQQHTEKVNNQTGSEQSPDKKIAVVKSPQNYEKAAEVIKPGKSTQLIQEKDQPQRWTINQQNTNLRQFVAQVATITGDTFILDPKLKGVGSINVISSKSMTKEEIYNIFLQVLNANDFAVVPKGERIKSIVSHAAAKFAGTDFAKNEQPFSATMVTQVIDLHSVSAIEVIPIVRPLIAQYGHAAASATGNVVVISDLKDNVERITRIIRDLDNTSDNDYEVFKLEHAWVNDVARVIQETLTNPRSSLPSGIHVIADERSNRLVIKGNASKRSRVRKLVQTLDQDGVRRSSTRVIFLRHADAKNLATILSEASQKLPQSSNIKPAMQRPRPGMMGNGSSPVSKLSDGIFIKADETTNSLIMIADPNTLKELEDLVRQLDVRRAQVLIEAAIVEVSGDLSESLGFQWGIDGIKTHDGNQTSSGAITPGKSLNSAVTGSFLGNNNIPLGALALRNANFGVLVNALTTKTNTNLLSTPSLLTLDNEEAELSIGQEVPFKTGSYANSNSGTGGSTPFTTTERKPVGLTLKVTPHVGDSNIMRLEIEQEISKLIPNSTNTLGTSDVVTDRRKLKATIIADNKQTVVMGGLLQDDTKKVNSKIPILGDIPILGKLLFSNKVDSREKKNLMLFIKATIMRDAGSLSGITKDKYNTLRVIRPMTTNLPEEVADLFKRNGSVD